MNILLIGQCTLHWGRMEFGNIGNYYIIEPFIRQLHATFENLTIRTTFQMSENFCKKEKLEVLPMALYYGWTGNDLELARCEEEISEKFKRTGSLDSHTPYIDMVLWSDLVIDFSGDIWGDNANFLGEDRFEVGLLKDLVAQNLGRKTVMLAGSPGPFNNPITKELAQKVYFGFDLVTNREAISTSLLEKEGFDVSKTKSLACPAFLFEPAPISEIASVLEMFKSSRASGRGVVGFILCGWNFEEGPFDRWPRIDEEYHVFAEAVEYISNEIGADVYLMSHANGFDVAPAPFKLKKGRDFPIAAQLSNVLKQRALTENYRVLDGIYDAWQTKAIIGQMDMLVSGRVHAAVAALSQGIPTVILDYGHEPKAHKLMGFAEVAGVQEFVADPQDKTCLISLVMQCWENRTDCSSKLKNRMYDVKVSAKENFELLRSEF